VGYSTDSDCPRLDQSILTVFHHGSNKPEVVFHSDVAGVIFLRIATGRGKEVASLIRYFMELDGFMRNLINNILV